MKTYLTRAVLALGLVSMLALAGAAPSLTEPVPWIPAARLVHHGQLVMHRKGLTPQPDPFPDAANPSRSRCQSDQSQRTQNRQ
jgi:NaMN:DMB phosphoribosyltransferase